ncbi:MAG: hypothetical protein V7609_2140 [Verrucomicrobiota bacterium]
MKSDDVILAVLLDNLLSTNFDCWPVTIEHIN